MIKYAIIIIIAIAGFIYLGYSIRDWQIETEPIEMTLDTLSYKKIEQSFQKKFDSLDSIKQRTIIVPQELKIKELDEDELEIRLNELLKD